jgi:hypothetical protein
MAPKDKAEQLVNEYRILLMNEDTECGNEILCTSIAKQCALIAVDEMEQVFASMLFVMGWTKEDAEKYESVYLKEVKKEINKL